MTGGPDEKVRFFFPLNRMADLDEWQNNRRIVMEAQGKNMGRLILGDLDLASDSAESILSYSKTLSRPWPDLEAPKYVWVAEVRVAAGEMREYAALAKRLLRAHEEHPKGLHWITYGNAIGGDRSELYYFYGFDKFGEVDDWPPLTEILSATLGDEEGPRLAAALEAISETTTSLWSLEPELSQMQEK